MGRVRSEFDAFGDAYRFGAAAELRRSLDIVAAVRDAIGDDVEILIEGHDRFSVATASGVARAIADYSPFWFETPVMSTEVEAMAEVARVSPGVEEGSDFRARATLPGCSRPGRSTLSSRRCCGPALAG